MRGFFSPTAIFDVLVEIVQGFDGSDADFHKEHSISQKLAQTATVWKENIGTLMCSIPCHTLGREIVAQ